MASKPMRRTADHTMDMLGQEIGVGDLVAVAVNVAYAHDTKITIARVENIYLDDSNGNPYVGAPTLQCQPMVDRYSSMGKKVSYSNPFKILKVTALADVVAAAIEEA